MRRSLRPRAADVDAVLFEAIVDQSIRQTFGSVRWGIMTFNIVGFDPLSGVGRIRLLKRCRSLCRTSFAQHCCFHRVSSCDFCNSDEENIRCALACTSSFGKFSSVRLEVLALDGVESLETIDSPGEAPLMMFTD